MVMDEPVLLKHVIVGVLIDGFGPAAKLNPVRTASAVIVSIYLHFILIFFLVFLVVLGLPFPWRTKTFVVVVWAAAAAVARGNCDLGLMFPS
jgi:hypothetical protein